MILNDIDFTNVATEDAVQEFSHKTIDAKDNTIKNSITTIEENTTLSPTGEMNVEVANGVKLTLGTAPYINYTLPIVVNGAGYVKFNGIWDLISVLSIPVYSTLEMKYIGTSKWGVNGIESFITTQSTVVDTIKVNDWKKILGQGSYTFFYNYTGASTDYDIPEDAVCVTVTWEGAQNVTARAVSYRNGNNKEWIRSFNGASWDANWTEVITGTATQTLSNKTIDSSLNTIKTTPTTYTSTQNTAINFTTETVIRLNNDYISVNLGTAPYKGYKLRVIAEKYSYVVYKGKDGNKLCIPLVPARGAYIFTNISDDLWSLDGGIVLYCDDTIIANAPYTIPTDTTSPRYKPADWRDMIGFGEYAIRYDINNAATTTSYGLPNGHVYMQLIKASDDQYQAIARNLSDAQYSEVWTINNAGSGLQSYWTKSVGGGKGTEHSATLESGMTGTITYIVQNGIAFVNCHGINTGATGNNQLITSQLPKSKFTTIAFTGIPIISGTGSNLLGIMYVTSNGVLFGNITTVNDGFASFSYPVAADWVEP